MKTYSILFIIVALMHTLSLVNITIFDGAWDGFVVFLSTILFLIAVVYFSTERRANIKAKRNT